jgi:hypothetical protein
MDGGGSDSNVTQTTTVQPSKYVQPYLSPFMGQALSVVMNPYQSYGGEQVAPTNSTQQQAYNMTGQIANSSNQQLAKAQGLLGGFASGANNLSAGTNPMMGMDNPYLQQAIDSASGDVVRNYQNATAPSTDAAFARSGAFGGSAWQNAVSNNQHQLTEDLGNIANSARMGDYTNQEQLQEANLNRQLQAGQLNNATQLQALGMVPGLSQAGYQNASALLGVGDAQQQQQQNEDTTAYQNWLNQQSYPYQQLSTMQSVLGTLMGTGGTTTASGSNPYASNPVSTGLGLASGGLGLAQQLGLLGGGLGGITAGAGLAGSLGASLGASGGLLGMAGSFGPALALA